MLEKIQLIKQNIFGSTSYVDKARNICVVHNQNTDRYYIQMGTTIPQWQGQGFDSLEDIQDILSIYDWNSLTNLDIDASDLIYVMNMYGLRIADDVNRLACFTRKLNDDCSVQVYIEPEFIRIASLDSDMHVTSIDELIIHLDELMSANEIDIFSCAAICNPTDSKTVVQAAISSRDLSKNLVRVKSSNMWAYTINIKQYGDKTGDVLVQFKGKNGGPGDIYMYFDVPVNIWRRWLSAPSKGHFFWENIRNVYKYRKLTGDKRGKLKNAVN